jgi:hypothetical protein
MAKHQAQPRFTPSGESAFDTLMRNARELFPAPVTKPPASTWPWEGVLDKLMAEAPDLSPEAVASARIEILRARQTQLQGWLQDRLPLLRARGLDAHLVGVEFLELICRSCGASWLVPAGVMPADPALACPNMCNNAAGVG